jgi:hypothetical protein
MNEAMQVQLKNLTTFDASRVEYFDLREEFGFASIVEMGGARSEWGLSLRFGGSNGSMPIMSS